MGEFAILWFIIWFMNILTKGAFTMGLYACITFSALFTTFILKTFKKVLTKA